MNKHVIKYIYRHGRAVLCNYLLKQSKYNFSRMRKHELLHIVCRSESQKKTMRGGGIVTKALKIQAN